jgi:hypothetical protein
LANLRRFCAIAAFGDLETERRAALAVATGLQNASPTSRTPTGSRPSRRRPDRSSSLTQSARRGLPAETRQRSSRPQPRRHRRGLRCLSANAARARSLSKSGSEWHWFGPWLPMPRGAGIDGGPRSTEDDQRRLRGHRQTSERLATNKILSGGHQPMWGSTARSTGRSPHGRASPNERTCLATSAFPVRTECTTS